MRVGRLLSVGIVSIVLGCSDEKAPEITAAPPGPDQALGSRNQPGAPRMVVIEGTLSRSADGSEEIVVTDEGYRYTLRRMPGCNDIGARVRALGNEPADVIYSDCLEYPLARLLVAQAIREKPGADNATLRQWLRTPGGQMTAEFQAWPDQDVLKMIGICRLVGRTKFISGDFSRPTRRQAARRGPGLQRRFRFRGVYRGRVFEAHSIEST